MCDNSSELSDLLTSDGICGRAVAENFTHLDDVFLFTVKF